MELKVYNINGTDSNRTINIDDALFAIEPNDHVIWLDVKQYLANQRQGTHKAKERSEVSGSTRKLKRQKGTGGARAGDTNSPTIIGGGRAFGPRPRDYHFKLNKKVKRLARISALSYKVKEDNLMIVEDFHFEMPKTKNMLKVLTDLNAIDKKILFILNNNMNNAVVLSARNLRKVKVSDADSINTYDVLNANKLVITETAIKELEKALSNL
ncbi:MAG: 50S ribosomal protein L4 [Bacteroidales bacterium]|jgi:large subunit ribosomal protein L4|nr:50S ribosomal protein L4 [Bacteroidales bacterium]